mgnify:CR=1 FL=1
MTQRVIKFRAMRDDMNPSWVYGSLLYGGDIPRIQELPLFSLFTTCLKGTEGQFTGIQDKNGKDVYEGDLLSFPALNKMENDRKGAPAPATEVKWEGYQWAGLILAAHGFEIEVIGNIYENPELLK